MQCAYISEYDFYPANYWVNDPMYNYPDGVINVTGKTIAITWIKLENFYNNKD